jgi:hypothetical protein
MNVDLSVDVNEDAELELADAPSTAARDQGANPAVHGAGDVAAQPIGDDVPTLIPGVMSQAGSIAAADVDTGAAVGPIIVGDDDFDAPTMIPGLMSQPGSIAAADVDTGSAVGPTIVGAGDDAPTLPPVVPTSPAGSLGGQADVKPASPSSTSGRFAVVPAAGVEPKSAVAETLAGLKPSSSSTPSSTPSSMSGRFAVVPATGVEPKSAVAEALAGLKPASSSSAIGSLAVASPTGPEPKSAVAEALADLKPATTRSSSSSSSGDLAVASPTGPEPKSAVAEALAGLKPAAPAAAAASAPRVSSPPPTHAPTGSAARPRPTSTGATTGTSAATAAGPPSVISEGDVRKAAMVGVVVVVAVVALVIQLLRPTPEPDLPLVRLPISAADCVRLKSVGRALHCEAPAASLNGLAAADREARLRETRAVARAGGFEQVVFEDKGRVWRVTQLRDAPATTTTGTAVPTGTAVSPAKR